MLAGRPAAEICAELSAFRRRIVRRVLMDAPLFSLAGPNGFVRYAGCATALAAGRSMEGEMSLSFGIRLSKTDGDGGLDQSRELLEDLHGSLLRSCRRQPG